MRAYGVQARRRGEQSRARGALPPPVLFGAIRKRARGACDRDNILLPTGALHAPAGNPAPKQKRKQVAGITRECETESRATSAKAGGRMPSRSAGPALGTRTGWLDADAVAVA